MAFEWSEMGLQIAIEIWIRGGIAAILKLRIADLSVNADWLHSRRAKKCNSCFKRKGPWPAVWSANDIAPSSCQCEGCLP